MHHINQDMHLHCGLYMPNAMKSDLCLQPDYIVHDVDNMAATQEPRLRKRLGSKQLTL